MCPFSKFAKSAKSLHPTVLFYGMLLWMANFLASSGFAPNFLSRKIFSLNGLQKNSWQNEMGSCRHIFSLLLLRHSKLITKTIFNCVLQNCQSQEQVKKDPAPLHWSASATLIRLRYTDPAPLHWSGSAILIRLRFTDPAPLHWS